jgi:hypothetical protein
MLCCGAVWGNVHRTLDSTEALELSSLSVSSSNPLQNPLFKVMSREDLKPMRDLNDVLQQIPGLQIRQGAGLGSFSQLSFQGSNGKQIKIYLDGVLLNRDGEAAVDVSKIPVHILERIEVDPLGERVESLFDSGVVSIYLYTKKNATRKGYGSIYGSLGSFNVWEASHKQQIPFSYKSLPILLNVYDSWQKAENNFPYWTDMGTEYNTNDDQIRYRTNNQYENITLGVTARFLGDHYWEIFLGGRNYTKHLAWEQGSSSYTKVWERTIRLKHNYEGTGLFNSGMFYTTEWVYQMGGDKRVDPNQTVGLRSYELERTWNRLHWKQFLEHAFQNSWYLQTGIALDIEWIRDKDVNQFNQYWAPPNASIRTGSLGQSIKYDGFTNWAFKIRWTGKVVWFNSDSVTQVQQPLKSFQVFDVVSSQEVSIKYSTRMGTMYSRIDRSSRYPTSGELLGDNNRIRRNLQLKAENVFGIQTGWKQDNVLEILGDMHLGLFYRQFEKPIQLAYLSPPDAHYENTENYIALGLEYAWSWHQEYIGFDYSMVWMDAKVRDKQSAFHGNVPGFTHEWLHNLGLWAKYKDVKVGMNGRYESEYYEAIRNAFDQKHPGYFIFGAYTQYTWKQFQVLMQVFNIADQIYTDFLYQPNSGRSYKASLSWMF